MSKDTPEQINHNRLDKCLVNIGMYQTSASVLGSSTYICKVPENLRKLNRSAYIPSIISIGPLHWKNKRLKRMQGVKRYYTNHLAARVAARIDGEQEITVKKTFLLQKCWNTMRDNGFVAKVKHSYAAVVNLDEGDLLEMLLLDGCFILELLYSSHNYEKPDGGDVSSGNGTENIDPIFEIMLSTAMVKHDLLLLENQIPFFVLQKLFDLTLALVNGDHSLTNYVFSYFYDIMKPEGQDGTSQSDCVISVQGSTDFYHILHLLHDQYRPVPQEQDKSSRCPSNCCPWFSDKDTTKKNFSELGVSALDLDYAGVKFVPSKGDNLFDVKFNERRGISWWFHRATFEIPTLYIHDPTEPFLRNLIALEQCCPGVPQLFTQYAKFIDMLINSEKDVEVLKKAKVMHNYLGNDKDVADLFNNMCKEVVIGNDHFQDVCEKASKYSERWWPKFMAYFRRTYFESPWAFIGFCVAFVAFGITVANFIRSFLK